MAMETMHCDEIIEVLCNLNFIYVFASVKTHFKNVIRKSEEKKVQFFYNFSLFKNMLYESMVFYFD